MQPLRNTASSLAKLSLPPQLRCYPHRVPVAIQVTKSVTVRHSLLVRVAHWLTFLAFIALLVTGIEILISHPRFYWGEVGNVNTQPLFTFHIPSSRDTVPTGYGYVLPDQNGWSRYLHFQAAWLLVLTGAVYLAYLVFSGHLRKHLFPTREQRSIRACTTRISQYLRRNKLADELHTYNVLQRSAYLVVIFVLFPLIIWTGLAMSPAVTTAFPFVSSLLGGRQTARTLHLFITIALVLFLIVHVSMVARSGFRARMRAMITGKAHPAETNLTSREIL
jgi:thiosulfate reductase cytochrome b subunit